jgi:hypothetical protein
MYTLLQQLNTFTKSHSFGPMLSVRRGVLLVCLMVSLVGAPLPASASSDSQTVTIILSNPGTGTWTVPRDWNSASNTIQVIGGGGSGAITSIGSGRGGPGGGGGAYAATSSLALTPGSTVQFSVGAGGAGIQGTSVGNDGTDTWFCSTTSNCATSGGSAVVAAAGGGSGGNNTTGGAGGTVITGTGNSGGAGGAGAVANSTVSAGGGGAGGQNGAGVAGAAANGTGAGGAGNNNTNGGGAGGTGNLDLALNGGGGTNLSSVYQIGSGGGGGGGSATLNSRGGSGGGYGGGGGGAPGVSGFSGPGAPGVIVITYTPVNAFAQEGFRFRNDNGSESAASWAMPQDTNITWGLNTNLRWRALLDHTGSGTTTTPMLQYKSTAESVWHPVGQDDLYPTIMATSSGRTTASTTSHSITLPSGIQTDDLLLIFFIHNARNVTAIESNGWQLLEQQTSQTGHASVVYYKFADGSDTATVLTGTDEMSSHVVYRIRNAGTPRVSAETYGIDPNTDGVALITDASRNYLWLTARLSLDDAPATAPPPGYNNMVTIAGFDVNSPSVSVADKRMTGITDDPGQWSSADEFSVSYTVAVPPLMTPTVGNARSAFQFDPVGSSDAAYGSISWNNPTRIIANDASIASLAVSGTTDSNYLKGLDFGFDIPSNATITGIEANISKLRSGGTTGEVIDDTVRLVKGGTVVGSNLASPDAWFGSRHMVTYGSSTELWGTTWTPADINDTNFGMVLAVQGEAAGADRTANVDNFSILVHYTIPSPIGLAPSTHIAASGANTTGQLTPPSGKVAGDFDAGRIQDDENPSDAIVISADDYTEVEWSIMATGTASTSDVYQIRAGVGPHASATSYLQNAQMTIGTYSSPEEVVQEGFRFRNDDGSETTATWKASQDTNITAEAGQNVRLRTLIDLTSTSTVGQFGLEYKLSSSSVWKSVGVDDAFPVIQATSSGRSNVNTTSHSITMPAGVQVGDLLLVLISLDTAAGTSTLNQPAGWERFPVDYNGDLITGAVYWQIATTTSPVLTLTSGTSEESTHIVYRISGAGIPVAFSADGSGTNSNPPRLNTSGARDYLSIVTRSGDTSAGTNTAATAAPAGYSGLITQFASTTNGANSNTAHRFITASSTHDPATFTSATEQWVSYTIAIPPAETPTTNTVRASYQTALTGNNNTSAGSIAWTNPGNITSTDNAFAQLTVSSTTASNYLVASTSGGLNIPTSATITGIEVHIERHRAGGSAGEIRDNTAQLMRNGALVGSNIAVTTNWGTGDRQMQYGSSTALWGTTWTPDDFNNGNFGFAFAVQGVAVGANRIARVDQIVVHVYYTIPSSIEFGSSTNIVASGASTTAQLTAPAGKTTGDFDAGRIQDDENPADSIAISTDDYTELEWSLVATGTASNGETYEFRIGYGTSSVTGLTEYLVTPQWTIGSTPVTPTILLSGTLFNDQGSTARVGTHTIVLAVGTSTPSTHSTTTVSGNGTFSFSLATSSLLATTSYTFFVDASSTVRAALVYQASSTNSTAGLNLYKDHIIVRSASSSVPVTTSNLAWYDYENDTDLQFSATSTATSSSQDQLNVLANQTFYVWPSTTFRAAASSTFSGSLDNDGIYNATSGQFARFTGTGRGLDGTLTGSSSLGAVIIVGSYVSSSTVASTTELTIASGGSFTAPSSALTVGDFTNSGTFADNGGTLNLAGVGAFNNRLSFVHATSVSVQDTVPTGLTFNSTGTKMYMSGNNTDAIYEYNLASPFNVSSASFLHATSVSAQDTSPQDVAFNPDGTKMYVLGGQGTSDEVNEYNLASSFNVSSASFLHATSVATQETGTQGFAFRPDGTKMYIVGDADDEINEYTLTIPWNVSTAVAVDTFSVATQETLPSGLTFSPDGTKLFVLGYASDNINEYALTTPWDVSTGVFVDAISVLTQDDDATGFAFKPDGSKLFMSGGVGDDVYEYAVTSELSGTLTGTSDLGAIRTVSGTTTLLANASTTNFTIGTSSAFTATSGILAISGDATFNGVFGAATGTVYLTGTNQTLNNNATTTFHNLYKVTTSAATTTFGAGDTFVTTGQLTLQGSTSATHSLRSTSDGSQWIILPRGSSSVAYLNVKDSRNASTTVITCTTGCIDAGNNVNWSFLIEALLSLSGTLFSDQGTTPITSGKTIKLVVGTSTPSILTATSDGTGAYSFSVATSGLAIGSRATSSVPGGLLEADGIAYGNGRFVAVGGGGSGVTDVMTSEDGVNWTLRSAATDQDWTHVVYGEGTFVAVTQFGGVMYSTDDGTSWTTALSNSDPKLDTSNGIAYGNGRFVAVSSGISNFFTYSDDGITWATTSTPTIGVSWQSISYLNGRFLATNWEYSDGLYYSTDGITWSNSGVSWDYSPTGCLSATDIAYGNGRYVAVCYDNAIATANVAVSTDGLTWTNYTTAEDNAWGSITYGNGYFVMMADDGTSRLAYSTDGINWTLVNVGSATDVWANCTAFGAGKFVSAGLANANQGILYFDAGLGLDTPLTFFVDNDAVDATTFLSGITSNTTNIPLYQNHVVTMNATTSSSTSVTRMSDMVFYDSTDDADVLYTYATTTASTTITGTTNLFLATGTTQAPYKLTVAGNFTAAPNSGFDANTGTVYLTGTNQTLNNNATTTFHNLYKVTTSAATTTFGAGDTFVTTGQLTLQGSTSANHILRSTSDGSQWIILPRGSSSVAYLNVKDSLNASTTVITCTTGCIDAGNNVNWSFLIEALLSLSGTLFSDQGTTPITSGKTIKLVVGTSTPSILTATSDGTGAYSFSVATTSLATTWSTASAAQANGWYGIAYGNGRFVAVGYLGSGSQTVMYSDDGVTWSPGTAGAQNTWGSVTYGNGRFVAVSEDGTSRVQYSDNGVTWTLASSSEQNSWWDVTYGNGLFVAVSINGTNRVMTSPDGVTWTPRSIDGNGWQSVTYGNGRFVAVGYPVANNKVTAYSLDGSTWTTVEPPSVFDYQSVTYGNGLFVAVSSDGSNRIITSPDGITWTTRTAPELNRWEAVTYGNGYFVAVACGVGATTCNTTAGASRVMYSSNGTNWTLASSTQANRWQDITYANGRFVAISDNGTNRVMTATAGLGLDTPLTFFVDNDAVDATTFLSGVTGNTTNIPLYQNHVVTMNATTSSSTSVTKMSDMVFYDSTDDADVLYTYATTTASTTITGTTNLFLATGTTQAPYKLTVAGNFTAAPNSGFDANTGTVYLTGTNQTLNNNATTTFHNLYKVTTSAATTTFGAGDTFVTTGQLTLQGSTSANHVLRSTSDGSQWIILPRGSSSVAYLNVKDSLNASTTVITCTTGCIDAGNNVNWSFVAVSDLVLDDHSGGQVSNVFSFQNENDAPFFAFSLIPTGTTTITTLTLRVSNISNNVTISSISDLRLFRDRNSNQVLDGGDLQVGGTGVFATSTATDGTIVFSTSFVATTTQDFIVTVDTNDIDKREALVLQLYPAGIVSNANVSGSVSSVYHEREMGSGGGGSSASIGGDAPAGQGVQTGGGNEGGGEAGQGEDGDNIASNPNFFRPTGQSGSWTNGANALLSDNLRAQAPSATTHVFNGFGFTIPEGNTIQGIEVKLDSRYSNSAGTISVELSHNSGTNYTTPKSTPTLATSDAVYTLGSPSDNWGRSWAPSELGDATFRVRVTASVADLQLDGIEVRIYHQASGGGGGGGGAL